VKLRYSAHGAMKSRYTALISKVMQPSCMLQQTVTVRRISLTFISSKGDVSGRLRGFDD
jgi:hypothetical protein